jgi:hypothetical protein
MAYYCLLITLNTSYIWESRITSYIITQYRLSIIVSFVHISQQVMHSPVWECGKKMSIIRDMTIKFVNSPPCACRASNGQKLQHGFMTLASQRFTAVLLLIYGKSLSAIYYWLCVLVSCFTTTHLLPRHCLWGSFQLASKTLSLFSGSSPRWLFCVPEDKRNIERKTFWWHWYLWRLPVTFSNMSSAFTATSSRTLLWHHIYQEKEETKGIIWEFSMPRDKDDDGTSALL